MARSTSRRPVRRGSWPLSALVWISVLVAASGIQVLLVEPGWLATAALVSAVVIFGAAGVRALGVNPIIPSFAGLALLVATITALFVPGSAVLGIIPTPGTVGDITELLRLAGSSIANQALPARADQGITFLLVLSVGTFSWAFDTLAFPGHAPAVGGAVLGALLGVPVVVDPDRTAWGVLVVTMLCYLGVLAVSRRAAVASPRGSRERHAPTRWRDSVVAAGAVLVVASLVAAVLPGFVRAPSGTGPAGSVFSGAINPILALGDDLRRPNPVTVLTYSSSAGSSEYLRVLTLDDFEGAEWAPADPGSDVSGDLAAVPAPTGLTDEIARTPVETDVDITALRSDWLPLPYPATSIDGLRGDWGVDPRDLTVSGDTTGRDDSYTVTSLDLAPTAEQLAAVPVASEDFDRYRELPGNVPDLVRTTAAEVTADTETDYAKAVAIQAYLRGPEFQYSEDAPVEEGYDGSGIDVLESFLTLKSGYCVHYSSAMAVMARELGIPARIAVGYQPGTLVPRLSADVSTYRVESTDLHAWPELFFEGVGWLPFEPTPSRGAPEAYSLPSAAQGSAGPGATSAPTSAPATQAPAATSTPTPTATASGAPGAAGSISTTGGGTVAVWLLVVLLVLLLPAAGRAAVGARRRRLVAGGSTDAAWTEITSTAHDVGLAREGASTPRQWEALVAPALADPSARLALARIRSRVEVERFAPSTGGDDSATRLGGDVALVRRALLAAVPPAARVRALLLPSSLVADGRAATRRRRFGL